MATKGLAKTVITSKKTTKNARQYSPFSWLSRRPSRRCWWIRSPGRCRVIFTGQASSLVLPSTTATQPTTVRSSRPWEPPADNHLTLTPSAITGASQYEIYRATSQSGTYTKMFTTTKTSYTNTSAKAGTTYYYKVKAISKVRSTANSSFSTVVSIKAK